MKIIEAGEKEKKLWNDFLLLKKGEFLQSWQWGNFQESFGRKIWRLGAVGDNEEILAVALITMHEMPLGKNYLYCPRGPVFKNPKPKTQNPKLIELFLEKIREIAKKENSVFFRLEPSGETIIPPRENAAPAINLQPRSTLILDITKSEEQLLAEMKQKTRYNIKLAEKRGVKIRISDKNTFEADFEKFWQLAQETSGRDGFKIHPREYYRKMLALQYPPAGGERGLNKFELKDGNYPNQFIAKLFFAEYEDKPLSANIVIFFGPRAVYLHGASSDENRNLMAPHLLQREQIKNARESGCEKYDFWGITGSEKLKVKSEKSDSWEGITRFKTGFGGKELTYPNSMDFVFQREFYQLIKFAKGLKKIIIKFL